MPFVLSRSLLPLKLCIRAGSHLLTVPLLESRQGLTTYSGPLGGPDTFLKPYETNTVQSLLEQKDTYEFMEHVGDIGYADSFVRSLLLVRRESHSTP